LVVGTTTLLELQPSCQAQSSLVPRTTYFKGLDHCLGQSFGSSNRLFQKLLGSCVDQLLVHKVPVLQSPWLWNHIASLEKIDYKHVIFISSLRNLIFPLLFLLWKQWVTRQNISTWFTFWLWQGIAGINFTRTHPDGVWESESENARTPQLL